MIILTMIHLRGLHGIYGILPAIPLWRPRSLIMDVYDTAISLSDIGMTALSVIFINFVGKFVITA